MKALLAGLIAATSVLGAAAASDAAAVKVVVKPGYPYYWHGAHYRYRSGSRYYNTRVKKCWVTHGHKSCTWKYK